MGRALGGPRELGGVGLCHTAASRGRPLALGVFILIILELFYRISLSSLEDFCLNFILNELFVVSQL